jgi:4-amino-4-deoxy-L-arabinose transferase-like glycosyltransferase
MATRRNLGLAGVLLGLVVVVAIAAHAHSPAGGGSSHGVDSNLIWEFVLVGVVALFLISLPLALWIIVSTRLDAPPSKKKRGYRGGRLLIGLVIFAVAIGIAAIRHYAGNHTQPQKPLIPGAGQSGTRHTPKNPIKPVPFDWLPAIVIISIAGIGAGVVTYVLFFRTPPRRGPTEAELAAQLSAVLDVSLEDLYAERDPRRAVIATYARMEQTLAGAGLPRFVSETPLEYLGRVLRDLLNTSAEAVSRLTALFERAKFSPHEIDRGMKSDAIDALVSVRDELRAVEA